MAKLPGGPYEPDQVTFLKPPMSDEDLDEIATDGSLTDAMRRAYDWLKQRGQQGVIDRYGRVVAGGEVATQFDSSTWLRLVSRGHLIGEGGRVWLTIRGKP